MIKGNVTVIKGQKKLDIQDKNIKKLLKLLNIEYHLDVDQCFGIVYKNRYCYFDYDVSLEGFLSELVVKFYTDGVEEGVQLIVDKMRQASENIHEHEIEEMLTIKL